jgi:hypothetical protein
MTQTAVKFLSDMISYTSRDTYSAMVNSGFLEQALQMEKEQHEYTAIKIAEFVLDKIDGESNLSAKEAFEQYYKTYGGKP